jgi:hypothetical protein
MALSALVVKFSDLTLWGTGRQAGPLPCSAW